jgi:hypothetical protein
MLSFGRYGNSCADAVVGVIYFPRVLTSVYLCILFLDAAYYDSRTTSSAAVNDY